jgi:2-polyprenyl-6-methoxyphenol hydroxylase-like FAD-dependent oxidoreductase
MRETDVLIAGSGLAGSAAAAMLGRMDIGVVVVDPHQVYPPDFRCEKLDGPQMAIVEKIGLTDAILRASTHDRESWVARFGRVVEKRPGDQQGIMYDTLVNTVRGQIPPRVASICAKVTDMATSADRQTVTLSNGETISARLVVVANGLNVGLLGKLGMGREVLSATHSISIGFNAVPSAGGTFEFPALTYYSERPDERVPYITLFPVGSTMRANLFAYREMSDPWLRQLRRTPQEAVYAVLPRLRRLMGDFTVPDFVQIRPVDLYVTKGYRKPGVVLVGDAFSTSCPAAGTGARKALTDVERLCNVHIPQWLATPGMALEKIEAFYDDPVKTDCDAFCLDKAYRLRSFTVDSSMLWASQRWAKFVLQSGRGMARRLRARLSSEPRGGRPPAKSPWIQSKSAQG